METTEIVPELYALRAGLSLIAREKDAFDAEVQKAEQQKALAVSQARSVAVSTRTSANDSINETQHDSKMRDVDVLSAKLHLDDLRKEYREKEDIINQTKDAEEKLNFGKRKRLSCRVSVKLFVPLYIASIAMLFVITFAVSSSIKGVICIPLAAISLTILITEICNAKGEHIFDTKVNIFYIGYGIPFIVNLLSLGGFTTMLFLGRNSGFLYWFIMVLIIISAIVCICFTIYGNDAIIDLLYMYHREGDVEKRTRAIKRKAELEEEIQIAERKYLDVQKENERERSVHERMILYAEKRKKNADEQEAAQCEKAEKDFNAKYNAALNAHQPICVETWNTLVKTYGELLDVRDWGILDLVIWQLETGRAETLKEALQLADRETQTDRIVQTLQSASAAIAQKIDVGFGNLQAQLSSSFYTLAVGLSRATSVMSRQIERSTRIISQQIGDSTNDLAGIMDGQRSAMLDSNRNLEQLFSQSSLQSALLEKANTSSQKLIDEVKKLRDKQAI